MAKALAVAMLKLVDTRQEAAALATALAVHWLPMASANADAVALAVHVPAPEATAVACSSSTKSKCWTSSCQKNLLLVWGSQLMNLRGQAVQLPRHDEAGLLFDGPIRLTVRVV